MNRESTLLQECSEALKEQSKILTLTNPDWEYLQTIIQPERYDPDALAHPEYCELLNKTAEVVISILIRESLASLSESGTVVLSPGDRLSIGRDAVCIAVSPNKMQIVYETPPQTVIAEHVGCVYKPGKEYVFLRTSLRNEKDFLNQRRRTRDGEKYKELRQRISIDNISLETLYVRFPKDEGEESLTIEEGTNILRLNIRGKIEEILGDLFDRLQKNHLL